MTTLAFDRIARNSLLIEARCEFLRLLRMPSFAVPTLVFPALFYLLFGVLLAKNPGAASRYLMATYCVFGIMTPGLFGFGVVVAIEREKGLLMLKRALPMPPANYLLAKLAMAAIFAVTIFSLLALLGSTVGGVRLEMSQWAGLFLVCVLGILPFCAMGLLLGTLVSGQSATGIGNLIHLPMAFLSGLWMPISMLPAFLQSVAPAWPAWHVAQLALAVIGQPAGGSVAGHLAYLVAFSALLFGLARRQLARGR